MTPVAVPQAVNLDPLRFPLSGSSLIEASAGTGKTFTIAMLYVRLVLGHRHAGHDDDFAHDADEASAALRALTPPDILVVTFTDAATKELRDRIRARLIEAAAHFHADPDDVASREGEANLLDELRADYPAEQWPACARRLELAAEWMDEAAVSTIHGWCNRMLSEHAFDSDSLFSQTLETDQTELRAEVARDYWRTFMAPLDARSAAEVRQWFGQPDALEAAVRGLLAHAGLLPDAPPPADALHEARQRQRAHLDALKANWPAWCDELQRLFDDARAKKLFNAVKLNSKNCETWLGKLRDWAMDPDLLRPAFDDKASVWERLTPRGIAEIWNDGNPPSHPAFDAMTTLREQLAAYPVARNDIVCHAAKWIAARFEIEQGRRSQMGFDDLLTRLRAALDGPNGERLAQIIRTQYPVALIDEFQDTDPVQYEIFDAVYRIAQNDPATAIILIGDPKQAIYAFRGADIYTYLAARRACAGRLYTLKKNFRSTVPMVAAVNRCFEAAETRADGAGAFLFRDARAGASAIENPLPFIPADANGRADLLRADGVDLPALTAWWLPSPEDGKPLGKDAYFRAMAASCASEMVRLLDLGQRGEAGFVRVSGDDGGVGNADEPDASSNIQPLEPRHMAVLVNNSTEARAIRAALAERGVRSVYLSDRNSVFQTGEAGELRQWLAACADPDDGRLVRTALATSILGLDWTALDTLNRDEIAWETRVLQFRGYRELWRRKGVLPMLRRLLSDFEVPQRLLGQPAAAAASGERTLTNVLHLAELLQQASAQLDGEHALLRYLDEAVRDGSAAGSDAQQLRLESDAGLVQVVTVHKSKGLEYPLVFLPFACTFREVKATDMPLKWHDEAGRLHITLSDESAVAKADRERLGEDLRKLYVALTRARYATWIGVAPIQSVELGALGYLLSGGRPIESGALPRLLEDLRGACGDIDVERAPEPTREVFAMRGGPRIARGAARTMPRKAREPWWIASYSSLRKVGDVIGGGAGANVGADVGANAGANIGANIGASARGDATAGANPQQSAEMIARDTRGEDVFHELLGAALPDAFEDAMQTHAPTPVAHVPRADASLHDFFRGADAGSFLHELMEWAATEGFANVVQQPDALRDVVARRCNLRGWARWIEPLTAWLVQLLSTPLSLPPVGGEAVSPVVLSRLDAYMAEMEFWVAAHAVDTRRVDQLVTSMTLDGAARPALEAAMLNGMLKGFIDLVFEHEGRYYVADYKSNWLGADDTAYTAAKMRAQILHSRYELQYVLYLFALHRLLKVRIADYDYDTHIGGAVYLFLRGGRAPGQGLHIERPPRELIEALDLMFAQHDDVLGEVR